MWRVLLVILFLAILAAINYGVVVSLWWWGYFQTTYNHPYGSCQKLEGTESGSEDIVLIPDSDGLALISSGVKKGDNNTGKIFLYDMKRTPSAPIQQSPNPIKLSIDAAASDFKLVRPHGMSIWKESDDIYLYVVSHQEQEVVEKFLFLKDKDQLKHELTIANESDFISLNDLAVVGKDKFYFTNTIKYCRTMELIFRLPFGSIGFYNGTHAQLVEENLFMPNGIALSQSGGKRFLYVGMSGGREIRVYSILINDKLSFYDSIEVSTTMDNLFVHSGDIWFGATPVLYKFMHYLKNPKENTSPSQIMRVKMSSKSEADAVEVIYSNNGTEISGSSSVAVYEKSGARRNEKIRVLLIGTVHREAYYCEP